MDRIGAVQQRTHRRSSVSLPCLVTTRAILHVISRIAFYVDGFNFYYGLMAKGWGRYRWLDYRALLLKFVRPGQDVAAIKYFTSLVNHQPEGLSRQTNYLRALEARGGIEIIKGEFEVRRLKCRRCGQWYKRPQEKRTDVNIATQLVADGYENLYDLVFLVSADADLLPAISLVKERLGRQVFVVDPPRRHSDELAAIADAHLHVRRSWLAASQLPDPMEIELKGGRTRRLYQPAEWRA